MRDAGGAELPTPPPPLSLPGPLESPAYRTRCLRPLCSEGQEALAPGSGGTLPGERAAGVGRRRPWVARAGCDCPGHFKIDPWTSLRAFSG